MKPPSPVDRLARDRLIAVIEDWLNLKITAFQFDDQLWEIRSKDQSVKSVMDQLWYTYDDVRDHQMDYEKPTWDWAQRILLLLKSNAQMQIQRRRIWSWTQILVALSLAVFLCVALWFGWGIQLLAIAIPFGIISICIQKYRESRLMQISDANLSIWPFESVAQLMYIRRAAPNFQKQQFSGRQSRPYTRSKLSLLPGYLVLNAIWLIAGPAVLFFQLWPDRISRTSIVE